LDAANRRSTDGSTTLLADLDNTSSAQTGLFDETVKLDLKKVNQNTSAILIYLHGGPRKYQFVNTVTTHCVQMPAEKDVNSLSAKLQDKGSQVLFQLQNRPRKDFEGIVLCVLYRDGWHDDVSPKWMFKSFMEPILDSARKVLDERCFQLVVSSVPTLEKYRPRVFNSVKHICAALSSTALPRLKKKFQNPEKIFHQMRRKF
jgi:hypothetical protein